MTENYLQDGYATPDEETTIRWGRATPTCPSSGWVLPSPCPCSSRTFSKCPLSCPCPSSTYSVPSSKSSALSLKCSSRWPNCGSWTGRFRRQSPCRSYRSGIGLLGDLPTIGDWTWIWETGALGLPSEQTADWTAGLWPWPSSVCWGCGWPEGCSWRKTPRWTCSLSLGCNRGWSSTLA